MASYSTWLSENLSSLDFCSLDTTEKSTDVITSLSLIKKLTEHLDTGNNCLLLILMDTNDFNFLINMKNTTLNSTCSNCTTASDCEDILDWHKEWLICSTLWIWDIAINCIHKLHDLVAPRSHWILKSLKSRTLNDRTTCEVILLKLLCNLHLN